MATGASVGLTMEFCRMPSMGLILFITALLAALGCDRPKLPKDVKASHGYMFSTMYRELNDYSVRRDNEQMELLHGKCRSIPQNEGSSGIFNYDDAQIYFYRSECLYDLALYYRNESVCDELREAKHFFYDGSRYGLDNCRKQIRILKQVDALCGDDLPSPFPCVPHAQVNVEAQRLADGGYEIYVESRGRQPGIYFTNIIVAPLGKNTTGSIQLEPLRVTLKSGTEKMRIIMESRVANLPEFREGFEVQASLNGPLNGVFTERGSTRTTTIRK